MSDEHLITLFQNGDTGVFEVLVLRHQERVRNFVYSILGSARHLDDFSQEIFIRVYQALPRFRFEAAFTTWLYRVTMNYCRDELRKQKLRRFLFINDGEKLDEAAVPQTPYDTAHRNEIHRLVQSAVGRLPLHYRVVLTLRDMEDYSYQEIAEILDCDVGTVKSRLARARGKVRNMLVPLLADGGSEGKQQ